MGVKKLRLYGENVVIEAIANMICTTLDLSAYVANIHPIYTHCYVQQQNV